MEKRSFSCQPSIPITRPETNGSNYKTIKPNSKELNTKNNAEQKGGTGKGGTRPTTNHPCMDKAVRTINRPEEGLSSGKLESTHPSRTVTKSIKFYLFKYSQSYAATRTHYSPEPMTTGPDYDTLLLLLALAGDVHTNPGPSRYLCSVCFKNVTSQCTSYLSTMCSHWVHLKCYGLRSVADYRRTNGWICTPVGRHHSHAHLLHHVRQDVQYTTVGRDTNGIGNKKTDLRIFLEAHNVKVTAIQESKLTAQLRSHNIQNYTLVRQDRRQRSGGGYAKSVGEVVPGTE